MPARLEPLRARSPPPETARYPGLTPEERGLDPLPVPAQPAAAVAPVPAAPIWVAPLTLPPELRPPTRPPPEAAPPAVEPADPSGLFDVPGLLERLWLARALEAHHERPWSTTYGEAHDPRPATAAALPSPARSGGVLSPPPLAIAPIPPPPEPITPPAAPVALGRSAVTGPPQPNPALRPRGWICAYCYLTNDEGATTCRGCRSGSLHL